MMMADTGEPPESDDAGAGREDEPEGRSGPPTPVRAMMGDSGAKAAETPTAEELPSRTIEIEGERWTALAVGWTRSGTAPDPGAPLLLVAFSRADDPDEFEREAIAVAESLAALTDPALEELFQRSRPFQSLPGEDERKERRTSPIRKNLRRRGD